MHVMQYEITLPADYDMGIIDRRIAERGAATDDFPHLGVKAYGVRRIGRHGSAVNAYAPFYLWRDPAGLNAFLYGPFRGIVTDFGRPAVRHWIGAAYHRGPGYGDVPVFATRQTWALDDREPPGARVERAAAPSPAAAGLHSEAVAVDPDRWELVRFTLWTAVPDRLDPSWTCFDVPHASAPGLDHLATGPHWH